MLIKRLLACINLYSWIKSNTAKLQMIYQMVFLYSDLRNYEQGYVYFEFIYALVFNYIKFAHGQI